MSDRGLGVQKNEQVCMTLHFSDYDALKIHGINDLTEYRSVTVFKLVKRPFSQ